MSSPLSQAHEVMPVTIIILCWNGLAYTRRCLETLQQNTSNGAPYRVTVVDNGSSDGTAEYLSSLDWVSTMRHPSNLGFAVGNNRAIEAAPDDADIILLNNDVEVHQPDWIERMQRTAYASPQVGIVGCRLRRPNGTLQHAGTFMPPSYWGMQVGAGEKDINQFNRDREVEGVVFACVYIRRDVICRIGLLDEAYFCDFEDSDYSLRAARAGYRTVCCGSVTLDHHENVSTRINDGAFDDRFQKSRIVFRRTWETDLEARRYARSLGWHSVVTPATGYGVATRNLTMALEQQGVRVAYRYISGRADNGVQQVSALPAIPAIESTTRLLDHLISKRCLDAARVQVAFARGDLLERNSGAYKVGYTMFEADGLPAEWVRQANLMDEVWVPSTFNVETFRRSGVIKPIHVMPLGVDEDYFNPQIASYHPRDTFVFLSVFDWDERKAPEILLRAYNDEFRASEPVVLLCRIANRRALVNVTREIAALHLKPDGGRVIYSINEFLPNHQSGALYRSADCFVLSTRGEGWGMPILEAMACGLPVIATDCSAQRDFMNSANAFPVQAERIVPAVTHSAFYQGLNWAQPSYEHLRVRMRHVFSHQVEARSIGIQASKEVLAKWTWAHSAARITERLVAIEH